MFETSFISSSLSDCVSRSSLGCNPTYHFISFQVPEYLLACWTTQIINSKQIYIPQIEYCGESILKRSSNSLEKLKNKRQYLQEKIQQWDKDCCWGDLKWCWLFKNYRAWTVQASERTTASVMTWFGSWMGKKWEYIVIIHSLKRAK